MTEMQIWAVYPLNSSLEQWTKEIGDKLMRTINNTDYNVVIEYINTNDSRIALYGWTRFPLFVAVKHGQPFRKIIGKNDWNTYYEWGQGLGLII